MSATQLLALFVVVAFTSTTVAQDAEVKKQKVTAVDNLKQSGVTKPATVETANLLVYSTLTEDKTKPVADVAQKAFEAAKKVLKLDEKDKLWPGKLTVYVLADRKEFVSFVRLVESRKPETDDMRSVKIRGSEPYAVVGVATGVKSPEAALREEAAAAVAVALLDQKAGANTGTFELPNWLHTGFGKAIAYRQDQKALDAHRSKVRTLFAKSRLGTFQAADVWGESKSKELDTLSVSLAEYLVYSPDAGKLDKFLGGYRPSDDRPDPNTMTALEAANWKPETLDANWKAWVLKQK